MSRVSINGLNIGESTSKSKYVLKNDSELVT